jgi:hypothetical protein
MIHFVRTVSIAPGKMAEAMTFAKEIASYSEGLTGFKVEVSVPIAGNPSRIAWHLQYRDLTELEGAVGKIGADAKFAELSRAGSALMLPGSTLDTLWRTI